MNGSNRTSNAQYANETNLVRGNAEIQAKKSIDREVLQATMTSMQIVGLDTVMQICRFKQMGHESKIAHLMTLCGFNVADGKFNWLHNLTAHALNDLINGLTALKSKIAEIINLHAELRLLNLSMEYPVHTFNNAKHIVAADHGIFLCGVGANPFLIMSFVDLIVVAQKNAFSRPWTSSMDLHGFDMSKKSLKRANLSGSVLTGANLFNTDLCGANLSFADVKNVTGLLSIKVDSDTTIKHLKNLSLSDDDVIAICNKQFASDRLGASFPHLREIIMTSSITEAVKTNWLIRLAD